MSGVAIAVAEAKHAARLDADLLPRLRAAMRATVNHWTATDEDTRFRAAVAAVWELSDPEARGRIELELRVLRALSALQSGVPVDLEQLAEQEAQGAGLIGLLKLWDEVKREGK